MDEEEEELRMTGTHGDLDSLAFTGTGTEPPITETMAARALDLGEGDPLAEADFHMAYGLYDQAADVIRGTMEREPGRRDLLAKLAEINFVWGNRDQFIDCARRLFDTRDQGSDSEWDKILIMGKQIAPEEPLFSGEPQAAADEAVDLALEATAVAAPMDLHLGEDESRGVDLDFSQALDTSGDTRETPALKQKRGSAAADDSLDFDFTGDTQETPTLETPVAESPTVETPTIESRAAESPTVETPTVEMPAGEEQSAGRARADDTAELELDDLGLDVSLDDSYLGPLDRTGSARALEEAAEGFGDEGATAIRKVDFPLGDTAEERERADRHADTETLAATDLAISEELGDDDATMLASTLKMPEGGIDIDSTSSMRADVEEGIDLDLSEFSAEEISGGDTAEQPGLGRHTDADITGIFERTAEHEALDLDVGDSLRGAAGDQTATESVPPEDMTIPEAEAVTMSEIGTKLDLARAYMDMGDPDGARSILQEVMEEGDEGQRADAERLMESLP
jgi:pilus assembly protein FimV